jgi:hypothetical protein
MKRVPEKELFFVFIAQKLSENGINGLLPLASANGT